MSVISTPFATSTEQLTSFFDASPPREVFEDVDIDYVARLLRHCNHIAQRCPRTYIVLRTVGELDHLERLINERFSDGWFPVDVLRLPSFLDPRVKNKIVQGQHIILTKSLNLENGKHSHFDSQETLPFEELGRIGSGTGGQVDRIESKISFKQYALKRISRRVRYGPTKSRETVDQILVEMKILKSLNHKHVVKYVGSYTNSVHLGIVISPLADMDLSTYMQQASATTQLRPTLQTFFGCLAASINYLHDKEVKHRDIKPQNILIYKSNVLITDFGLSRDFLDTTSGRTSSTPRYCPPEVADWKKRNWSADIWSMGCVFLEMAAALHGHDVMWVRTYYEGHHTRKTHFHANSEATEQLLSEFEASWDEKEKILLTWIRSMMAEDREARPTAARVIELITSVDEPDCSPTTFCGICCATDDSADS
ncbi:kinase-like protein [Dothidotthia symphoricarpi CBS 119687]|uniref:Kinase-like protein n=1 Tax=Dothidotthia symphoricarpi CBS 119687 TaxID=1392245 RepID=A0A6A6A150_9PLEO|nr:kinase-like protein [Dothidotthia symphoricarpi CBS 119687]KAF2124893.1 kinase-like protein [Dothidotthia symphoricarpi CBS 119687]